jgi:hypothetical protein
MPMLFPLADASSLFHRERGTVISGVELDISISRLPFSAMVTKKRLPFSLMTKIERGDIQGNNGPGRAGKEIRQPVYRRRFHVRPGLSAGNNKRNGQT